MTFLIQQTLIYSIPLLIVAIAGVFSERSGIINIALDGMMIFGAFVGSLVTYFFVTSNVLMGSKQLVFIIAMLCSAISGALFSLLLSFSSIKMKADQTIGGTALNLLAPALVLFFIVMFFHQNSLNIPKGAAGLFILFSPTDLGVIGNAFFDKVYISTYIVIALYIALSILLYKTKFGLRLRACGEHPQAADSLGVNVYKMRYLGVTISGALAGLGGFIYVVTTADGSVTGSVQGFGFLALAIMIFGNWKPGGIALGALLFGLLKCISASYDTLDIFNNGVYIFRELGISPYIYNMIPYITTLAVLALTSKRSRAPKAEGVPYNKGMR
ncbi:MAG: ABC transporter permease [Clostridia bacterium]